MLVAAVVAGLALVVPAANATGAARPAEPAASPAAATPPPSTGWRTSRVPNPARTLVEDSSGRLLATFTDGSRSVVLAGPARTFAESTTTATVTTTAWVRLLPAPFRGAVDLRWLRSRLADSSPDVLGLAMAFTTGVPEVQDSTGAHLSGDASYGPAVPGGREEGADWNDYLGLTATYAGKQDPPEADQLRAMDCSGFVRMVFGRRLGLPMTLTPDGARLPRRAVQMAASAPGTVLVPDRGTRATRTAGLLAGDLVFFDVATDDGRDIDHVGIYLGTDSQGHPRFVSSRKTADGPTMGDVGGRSRLDGTGLYATGFRSARRL